MSEIAHTQSRKDISAELELPYAVEICSTTRGARQVLARCATSSLAYAVFYAALRERPNSALALRHGGRTLARSAT